MPMKLKLVEFSRSTPLHELPQLMTEQEVARYLALSIKKLVRLRYERRGPRTVRLGSTELVRREDLVAWIETRFAAE